MSERGFPWLALALLPLAGCVAYANTLRGDWVWDDASSVLLHRHVQEPAQFFQLFREDQHAFGRGQGNFYRPLVAASFMLDYQLSHDPADAAAQAGPMPRLSPLVFHITNALWHIAAAMLLLWLLWRLGAPPFALWAAPMLFLLHPLHTEAVAYISGRADMMSGVFMLAALCCVARLARVPGRAVDLWDGAAWVEVARPARAPGWAALAGCAALFALGLLSKESTLILPVLIALFIAACPAAREWGARRYAPLAATGVVLIVYIALRATVLRFAEGGGGPGTPLAARLVETAQSFALYARVLLWPTGLHMERVLDGVPAWVALLGAALLAGLVGGAVAAWRAGHWRIAFGLAWFLAAWLPISGVFPLNAPMAEHWMYVPMMGLWWAAAEAVALLRAPAPRRAAGAVAVALCAVFLFFTVQRNADWGGNTRLFQSTLAQNPDTMRVHYNLAVTFHDLEGNLPGARRHYEAVLEILAREKARAGQPAATLLESEIEVHEALGDVLLALGEYIGAARHYRVLAALSRSEAHRHEAVAGLMGLGKCFLADGDVAAASHYFAEAVALAPEAQAEAQAWIAGRPLRRG